MGRRRDAAADPQQHPSLGRPRSEAANPVETIIPTNSITCTVERCTGTWWPITTSATRVVISGPYRVGALTPAGKSPTAVCPQPGQDFSSGPGTRSPPGAAAAPGHGPDGDVPHHGAATSGVPRHTPRSLDRDDLVRVIDLAQRRTRLTDLLTWLATRPGPRRPTPRPTIRPVRGRRLRRRRRVLARLQHPRFYLRGQLTDPHQRIDLLVLGREQREQFRTRQLLRPRHAKTRSRPAYRRQQPGRPGRVPHHLNC